MPDIPKTGLAKPGGIFIRAVIVAVPGDHQPVQREKGRLARCGFVRLQNKVLHYDTSAERERCEASSDDGVSTFSNFCMATTLLRLHRAAQIVIAVPIASAACVLELRATVNDVVTCTARTIPGELDAAGQWYEDCRQVPQESVRDLYERAKRSFGEVGTLEPKTDHNRPANGYGGKR